MRIRMVQDRTGQRWDGQDWPVRGGEFDVPDDEGVWLCEQGYGVPVAKGDSHPVPDPDTADVETRAEPDDGGFLGDSDLVAEPVAAGKPIVNAPKADWIAHAVSQGADPNEAAGMKKSELIAAYGNGA